MITMTELEDALIQMMHALRVNYKVDRVIRGISVQFVIEQFGTIVCGINRQDYKLVDDQIKQSYPDWRVVYITTFDNMLEKKEEVIWKLMEGGYMRWIRLTYPRPFTELVVMQEFGKRIIDRRLEVYSNKPKYRSLIEDNEDAKNHPATTILSWEPGFYDYMPEKE